VGWSYEEWVWSCSHGSVVVEVLGWLPVSRLFLTFRLFFYNKAKENA